MTGSIVPRTARIRCSCPAKVKQEGAGAIPAKKLLDYVWAS